MPEHCAGISKIIEIFCEKIYRRAKILRHFERVRSDGFSRENARKARQLLTHQCVTLNITELLPTGFEAFAESRFRKRFLERRNTAKSSKNIARFERLNFLFNSGKRNFIFAVFDFDAQRFEDLKAGNEPVLKADFRPKKLFAFRLRFVRMEKRFIR